MLLMNYSCIVSPNPGISQCLLIKKVLINKMEWQVNRFHWVQLQVEMGLIWIIHIDIDKCDIIAN